MSESHNDNDVQVSDPERMDRQQALRKGAALGAAVAFGGSVLGRVPQASASAKASTTLLVVNGWTQDTKTGMGKALVQIAKDYKKIAPTVDVRFEAIPNVNYLQQAVTRARSGRIGDVYVGSTFGPERVLHRYMRTVTPKDVGPLRPALSGWQDLEVAPSRWAGIPLGRQGEVWYFNKALFERAGLSPTTTPETWAEFAAVCTALKRAGIDPIGISAVDSYFASWMLEAWSTQYVFGLKQLNAVTAGKFPVSGPRFYEPLKYVAETYRQGWWQENYKEKKYSDVNADFAAGRVAMVCGLVAGTANWALWDETLGKGKYGVFFPPRLPTAVRARPSSLGTTNVAASVPKTAKNPAEGLKLAKFMGSRIGQVDWLLGGQFPNRSDVNVRKAADSAGGAQVSALYAKYPSSTSPYYVFTSLANGILFSKLTTSIESGDLQGLLDQLDEALKQG